MSSTDDDERSISPSEELELQDTTSIKINVRELMSRTREHRRDIRDHQRQLGEIRVSMAQVDVHVKNLTRAFWLVGGAVVTGLVAGFLAVLKHLP